MKVVRMIFHRPETLWAQSSLTPSVGKYIKAFGGEFNTEFMESEFPYSGRPSNAFRRITRPDPSEHGERFEDRGHGCWALKRDHILNPLTADLLAAADAMGGTPETDSASTFRSHVERGKVWVSFLDGGVGVAVMLSEHETTNRVHASQRTTIRGPRAYRTLLELLGFDWIKRRLQCESATPCHEEIREQVAKLLKGGSSK